METRYLELFADVANSGSFAETARRRNLDPSSVSRAIASLESDFGARLFQRSTRRLALTEAGQRFLERVEPVLAELEQAREDALAARREPRGTLRIATSVAFGTHWLIPRLGRFYEMHPRLAIELDLSDRNVDLVAERIDLAIRLGPPVDSSLVGARLMDTRYRVVAARGFRGRGEPLSDPAELADLHCVGLDLPAFRSRWIFRDAAGALQEIAVKPRLVVSSAITLRAAILAGIGYGLMPDWLIAGDLDWGDLVDLLPGREVTATTFDTAAWLLYPSRSFLPGKTRTMIDYLRNSLTPSTYSIPEDQSH